MEQTFDHKNQLANALLSDFEGKQSHEFEKSLKLLEEVTQLVTVILNLRDKIHAHVTLSRANRIVMDCAPVPEMRLFYFENAIFEVLEAFAIMQDPTYQEFSEYVVKEGQTVWRIALNNHSENEKNMVLAHPNSQFFKLRILSLLGSPENWMAFQHEKEQLEQPSEPEIVVAFTKLTFALKEDQFSFEETIATLPVISSYDFNFNG